jgi:phosphatidylglycerophosphatase A
MIKPPESPDRTHTPIKVSARHRTVWPSFVWLLGSPNRFLMFGLGSGLIRPGAGTWGTLVAWGLWVLATPYLTDSLIALLVLTSFLYGCWACGQVGKALGVHDHVGMVWDEFVAFWLVLWLIPTSWVWQLIGFGIFRFFDIAKPVPIRQVDSVVKGGFGVMIDDIIAAGYTLLVVAIVIRLLEAF